MAAWLLFVILVYLPNPSRAAECTFSQITKVLNSTSLQLSWTLLGKCQKKVDYYKVIYHHVSWLACYESTTISEDDSRSKLEAEKSQEMRLNEPSLVLENLFPYSNYSIIIEAIDKGYTYNSNLATYEDTFVTESAPPEIKPMPQNRTRVDEHLIIFHWSEPHQQLCTKQNGKLDGYLVELRGIDPWARSQDPVIKTERVQALSYSAFNLQPYTTYELWVYAQNLNSAENKDIKLKIRAKTLASNPVAPVNLTAVPVSSNSVHLSWSPAYPRTGEIDHYVMRKGYKDTNSSLEVWTAKFRIESSHESACPDAFQSNRSIKICYVINDLIPRQIYLFQVKTISKIKNEEIGSEWSDKVSAETLPQQVTQIPVTEGLVVSTENNPATLTPEISSDTITTLVSIVVVVVSVVVLIIVAIVFRYRWKLKALKERLRLEQSINTSRLDPNYTFSMSTLDTSFRAGGGGGDQFDSSTLTTTSRLEYLDTTDTRDSRYMDETILSQGPVYTNTSTIQSRRLPVPPPLSVTGPPQIGLMPNLGHKKSGKQAKSHQDIRTQPLSHQEIKTQTLSHQEIRTEEEEGYDTPRSITVHEGYLDMSLKKKKKYLQNDIRDDLVEDTVGYMKPKFNTSELNRSVEMMMTEDGYNVPVIPAASYGQTNSNTATDEVECRIRQTQENHFTKTKDSHEADHSKTNLLQYERPDLLATVKAERSSQDSEGSDGSSNYLLPSSRQPQNSVL